VDPLVRAEASLVRERVDSRLASKQVIAWLVGPTAVIALLLAAFGVYGVTSFAMSQRQTEVSVRMAIGASSADILRLLVSDGLRPVMAGLVVGLALALVATRLSARMLEISGVSPNDPIAIGLAMSALMACALVAVIAPARRAARMDPASLLRQN
jgi:ABC-type antimicrobial peptide transport system permease subunit